MSSRHLTVSLFVVLYRRMICVHPFTLYLRLCATRDIVEVRMDLNGVPCIIRDTAGVRAESLAADEIEMEGIKRAK